MNKGKVTINFVNGESFIVQISVGDAQAVYQHTEWRQLVDWWVYKDDKEYCSVGWEDGSMMLLARSKIVGITLEPITCLEIN